MAGAALFSGFDQRRASCCSTLKRDDLRKENAVLDAEDQAAFDGKQHGVVAIAHPYVTIGRIDQSEISVSIARILAGPECHRQDPTEGPALVVPTARPPIVLAVIAVFGGSIYFVRPRVEVLLVVLPLRRLMAGLIGCPIVVRVL